MYFFADSAVAANAVERERGGIVIGYQHILGISVRCDVYGPLPQQYRQAMGLQSASSRAYAQCTQIMGIVCSFYITRSGVARYDIEVFFRRVLPGILSACG